uniref:Uncharacterized protein LOC105036824 n=1 Tax=Elaeis guineensis var. tenera TaxID=51953 RepID=A0A8N4F2I3_ELAGV
MPRPCVRRLFDPSPDTNLCESSLPSSPGTQVQCSFLFPKTSSLSHQNPSTNTTANPDLFSESSACCFGVKCRIFPLSLMAHGNRTLAKAPTPPRTRVKDMGVKQRRQELEQEVAQLQKMLNDEEKVHEVLERALLPQAARHTLHIPSFLPKK